LKVKVMGRKLVEQVPSTNGRENSMGRVLVRAWEEFKKKGKSYAAAADRRTGPQNARNNRKPASFPLTNREGGKIQTWSKRKRGAAARGKPKGKNQSFKLRIGEIEYVLVVVAALNQEKGNREEVALATQSRKTSFLEIYKNAAKDSGQNPFE